MRKYEDLKRLYSDYITLDQFYKILHVAKRSARYLLENGIVPATDTGKKTWRWKIHIDDVTTYLRQRDKSGSMIPPGAVSSKNRGNVNYATGKRLSFAQLITPGKEHEVSEYFKQAFADCADILTTADIAEMTGLHKTSLLKMLQAGHIKSLDSNRNYLVPKLYLLEFVVTRRFLEIRSSSERFAKLMDGFEKWKANNG